jgi:DNA mismatch repair protein MutL
VLALTLPTADVDVNAHPQKTEVRFKHSARLFDVITRMLASRLGTTPARHREWDPGIHETTPALSTDRATDTRAMHVAEGSISYAPLPPDGLRLIGQLRNRYLLCEGPDCVYLIDRHRADELVRFDELEQTASRGHLVPRALLFPDRIQLDSHERRLVEASAALLTSLGFDWSALGERSYALRAVPSQIGAASATNAFKAAVGSLRESAKDPKTEILHALARAAATAPGVAMDRMEALDIVSRLRPSNETHRLAFLAEVRLPDAPPEER